MSIFSQYNSFALPVNKINFPSTLFSFFFALNHNELLNMNFFIFLIFFLSNNVIVSGSNLIAFIMKFKTHDEEQQQ